MASEKGDLPHDTDSLPPNYASSDVYTDSAPPAYRKTNTVRLQITRVVCLTVLTAGFLTGAFILAHTWISTRNACDCGVAPNLPPQSASLLQASSLPSLDSVVSVEPPKLEEVTENDLESSQLDQESRQMDIPLPSEEESDEANNEDEEDESDHLELAQEAMEEEQDSLQGLVEAENKVKLPIDLLLGNPALAGKDVQCKVEKKMQNLGGGILSKTIIVTCDDDNDANEEAKIINPFEALLGSRPAPQPPMSLLAPILKMMAARANARLQRQMQPRPVMRRFPQPMMQPIGLAMSGPFPAPFPGHFEGPAGPSFGHPMMASFGIQGPMNQGPMNQGPMPAFIASGPMPMPGNSIMHLNQEPMHFNPQESSHQHLHHHSHGFDESDMPFQGNQNGPFENMDNEGQEEQRNMPFREMNEEQRNMPFRDMHEEQRNMPFRDMHEEQRNMPFRDQNEEEDNEQEQGRPFMQGPDTLFRPFPPQQMEPQQQNNPEEPSPTPIKIVHGFPPQIPEAIKQIVSHIMRANNKEGQDKMPVIAIKAIPESRSIDSNQGPPRSKLLLPFPFRAVKVQTRGGRQFNIDENREESFGMAPFPLPRGALSSGLKPLEMPEAAGRALDSSPVALPSLQELPPRFFPGNLLRLPEGRAITHMEMKQNPNEVPFSGEKNENTEEEQQEPMSHDDQMKAGPFGTTGPDFGPPRLHTVIRGPPPVMDNISQESNPLPPFLRRFPPPPQFASEGRSGIVTEVNPDAELVTPAETREHHMIMVN